MARAALLVLVIIAVCYCEFPQGWPNYPVTYNVMYTDSPLQVSVYFAPAGIENPHYQAALMVTSSLGQFQTIATSQVRFVSTYATIPLEAPLDTVQNYVVQVCGIAENGTTYCDYPQQVRANMPVVDGIALNVDAIKASWEPVPVTMRMNSFAFAVGVWLIQGGTNYWFYPAYNETSLQEKFTPPLLPVNYSVSICLSWQDSSLLSCVISNVTFTDSASSYEIAW